MATNPAKNLVAQTNAVGLSIRFYYPKDLSAMPVFLSTLSRIRKGGLAMNELLTWGVPITLVGLCIGTAFAVLQLNEVGTDEFWISRGCFILAAVISVGRIVLWEATTPRAFLIRLAVGFIAFGLTIPFTVEAIRYVNRKQARWTEAQKPPPVPLPAPAEVVTSAPAVSARRTLTNYEQPNLVVKRPAIVKMLAQGQGQERFLQRRPNGWRAAVVEIKNDPDSVDYDISDVDVRGFISFEELGGEHTHSVSDAVWENHYSPFVRFRIAETHTLVVACELDNNFYAAQHDAVNGQTFVPLSGFEYHVQVQLFAKVPGREKSMLKKHFKLMTRPEFTLTLEPT